MAASPDVVISQVYGGGGNSGATLKNDFVELYNRGPVAVDVTGWSVQYASSAGTSWQKTVLAGVVQPGSYYLVAEAAGAGGIVSLPTPNATGSIAMSASAGKVALLRDSITCSGTSCSNGFASIVDAVGYGLSTNFSEGAPTPNLSNTTAAHRKSGGAVDTDVNFEDFTIGTPDPHSSPTTSNPTLSVAANPRTVAPGAVTLLTAALTPGENPTSTGLSVVADLSPIGGSSSQPLYDDGTNGDATANDGRFSYEAIVSPATSPCGKTLLFSASDAEGRSGSTSVSLMVAPTVTIAQIQGASHLSPFDGECVAAEGVVTAVSGSGFYFQSTSPDADPATSEGVFVYTPARPTVGASVLVGGPIDEYRPGGVNSTNLTTTEFNRPVVDVQASGIPSPTPVVVGLGGRMPPTEVIENDATSSVETSGVFDPSQDGIDFYESLEGMLVQVDEAVAVGPTNGYGELAVVPDGGSWASVRSPRGGIVIRPTDSNPERIIVDDTLVSIPAVKTGATFSQPIVGVLDYSFGNYKLFATSSPAVRADDLQPEKVSAPAASLPGGKLSVASFNVENLAPTDPQSKFDGLASLIVDNLGAPDLIAVEEVQDNNGVADDGTVAADATWSLLVDAIEAAGGPTYAYRQVDPANDSDGGAPGANIRQGFLFRVDRGLSFVDRGSATATSATSVEVVGGAPRLSLSPGRVEPTDAAFEDSRKPLAGEFLYGGETLFVVANHFNSKGGDQPLFGRYQPPALASEAQRVQQATVVAGFVESLLAADPQASVVVLGDLNDFQFSEPLEILKAAGLTALIESLPVAERYTYVYDGNSEALDHVLVSEGLASRPFSLDVVHVNAEFPDALRASDHDPQVAEICVDRTAPSVTVSLSPSRLWPPDHQMVRAEARVMASDNSGDAKVELVGVTSSEPDDGLGDGDTPGDVVIVDDNAFQLRAERSGVGDGRTYTITYRATDACGNSTTASATVVVPLALGPRK